MNSRRFHLAVRFLIDCLRLPPRCVCQSDHLGLDALPPPLTEHVHSSLKPSTAAAGGREAEDEDDLLDFFLRRDSCSSPLRPLGGDIAALSLCHLSK